MKNIPFTKMHGTGNDFIVIEEKNCIQIDDYGKFAKEICNRRFSVGADGLLLVCEPDKADIKMEYYNSDGSLAKMCGNGIRCFAKYVYDKKIVNKTYFTVSTLAGLIDVKIEDAGDTMADTKGRFSCGELPRTSLSTQENRPLVSQVTVNLGKPIFTPEKIPVLHDGERFVNQKLVVNGESYTISSILLGVPHTIVFREEFNEDEVIRIGAIIENNEIFPEKTNVNFAKVVNQTQIRVKTWERGAGYTLACGTGSSSVYVLASLLNYVDETKEITIETDGGNLRLSFNDSKDILLKGPAVLVFEGII